MAGALNIGITGMLVQQDRMNIIGNNVANSRTVGFKGSTMQFGEEYTSRMGQFLNGVQNQFGNGVHNAGVTTDWGNGSIQNTSNPSHLAISGDGFFPVSYQGQITYTRAGDFALIYDANVTYDVAGTPTTGGYVFRRPNGATLLGQDAVDGAVAVDKYLVFDKSPSSYEFAANGVVRVEPSTGPNAVTVVNGQVGLQRFNNSDSMSRLDNGLFLPTVLTSFNSLTPAQPGASGVGTLYQGSLEESNVDLVTEFTDMILTQRAFTANSKTITTADEMLQTVLNLRR